MRTTNVSQFGELHEVSPLKSSSDSVQSTSGKNSTLINALRVVVESTTTQLKVVYAPRAVAQSSKTRELNRALRQGFTESTSKSSR